MSRKNRFGCQGNVISPLMQRLWSSRNHFLKSAQNSDLETTLKPFALRHVIKSASSLGLTLSYRMGRYGGKTSSLYLANGQRLMYVHVIRIKLCLDHLLNKL